MVLAGPLPQVGREGTVKVAGYPLVVIPGTYSVSEAERFGQKISTGSLSYADFSPHTSAHASATWVGGYGLQRYSDVPEAQARAMYREASSVECGEDGIAFLAPKLNVMELPWDASDTPAPPVWIGQWGNNIVCVAGRRIFSTPITDGAVWTRASVTLPADALRGAVGQFGSYLIIGFGGSATARYVDANLASLGNVTDDATPTANNLYVYAFSADRASSYIAGGTASTDAHIVWSSTNGIAYATGSKTTCGSSSSKITSLSPGMGIATLFVGKETELGMIDNNGVYKVLVPFDSTSPDNCRGMRQWLSRSTEEQRGAPLLVFPRDRSLWVYRPSSENAGEASNISPWSMPGRRPDRAVGATKAIQGTARWLYYSISSNDGSSNWIIKYDLRTGAPHSWLDLGSNGCQALAVATVNGRPRLYMGYGTKLAFVPLPLDGESALTETSFDFAPQGTLTLPDIDLGFPDEDKVGFSISVVADNLYEGYREIEVYTSRDEGGFYLLGKATSSPSQTLTFQAPQTFKRLGIRCVLKRIAGKLSPQLRAVIARMSINPQLYRIWRFRAAVPAGYLGPVGVEGANPSKVLDDIWEARSSGVPVEFVDIWGKTWTVRVLSVAEDQNVTEGDRPPETILSLTLLQHSAGSEATMVQKVYSGPAATGYFFPIFPMRLGESDLYASDTLSVALSSSYPRWEFKGPGGTIVLRNETTGEEWRLNHELLAGESVSADFDPTKLLVFDQDGNNLSSKVASGSVWWSLRSGANTVSVRMYRATPSSSIKVIYRDQ